MNEYSEILTTEEVAELLGVSRNTVGRLIRERKLKGFKIGSRVYKIPREAVNEFIRTQSGLK